MRKVIYAYLSNWKFRASAIIAALIAFGSVLVLMNNAYDNATSIWQKIEIVYTYAATPWLGVFILLAVTVVAAWGYRDVVAAQERGNLADQIAQERETKIRVETLESVKCEIMQLKTELNPHLNFVRDLGDLISLERHYERARNNLEMARKLIAEGSDRVDELATTQSDLSFENIRRWFEPIQSAQGIMERAAGSLENGRVHFQELLPMQPKPEERPDAMRTYLRVVIAENPLFMHNVRVNLETVRANFCIFETNLLKMEEDLKSEKEALWAKFQGTPR